MQRQLSYRVTTPDRVTWQGVRAAWKDEAVFAAVGERAAEIIFVRHITQLQMQAAEAKKAQAAEVRAALCASVIARVVALCVGRRFIAPHRIRWLARRTRLHHLPYAVAYVAVARARGSAVDSAASLHVCFATR